MRSAFVLACLLGATHVAAAKPAAGAQAEALFNDAKKLMGEKKYAEACDKFDASQKADPAITTQLNAADCREKNGQLATAWGLFLEVERQARSDASAAKLGTIAHTRAGKLEPRLSKLTINVAPDVAKIAGLKIMLGSDQVSPGTFGTALPMDGGHYTITASAPGTKPFSSSIDLAVEGDSKSIDIPKLGSESQVQTPVVAVAPPTQPDNPEPQEPVDEPGTPAPSHKAAIIASVGAVALAGGAIVFELSGRSALDKSAHEPDPTKQDSLYNKANSRHFIAQGMGAAAVAVTGVAIYLWVRGGHASNSSSAMIVPAAGPDQLGFAITGAL